MNSSKLQNHQRIQLIRDVVRCPILSIESQDLPHNRCALFKHLNSLASTYAFGNDNLLGIPANFKGTA
jgi:hypothetical protein